MSSYLLDSNNMSFIANALCDINRNDRLGEIMHPLRYRCILFRGDRNDDRLKFYKKLMAMNYEALSDRYKENPPTEEMLVEGYVSQGNWYNFDDKCKMYYTLAEVISCYLYQCCEGDVPNNELYKALKEIESNLYKAICRIKLGEFDGWASVSDLSSKEIA